MQLKALASILWIGVLATMVSQCNLQGFSTDNTTQRRAPANGQQSGEPQAGDASSDRPPVSLPNSNPPKEQQPVTPYRVAFIGDQGLDENARRVLQSIKASKTDLTVILGDFDYDDNPDAWEAMLNETLGDGFPVIAAVGNHDTGAWEGYRVKLEARLAKMKDVKCTGEYGVNMACTFKDMTLVLSGVGTMGADGSHETFIDNTFKAAKTPWKVCNWHKNQRTMQAGGKSDEVGWLAYETCRMHGAIVATAHEHSYARTHLLSNFEMATIASNTPDLVLEPGKSFAFVSGLGGNSVRSQSRSDPHFAKIYTSNQNGTYGALFCEFGINNDPRKARCQFKNVDNVVIDDFTLTSKLPAQ